ncbi:hypothetical protein FGO68_gene13824 [Halteria grandinella]|uniref:Uncharacterized protein n=1 Tax=Halteria grandinella TaxID=5974 RepID=A0A8J8NMG3_HALGN|nr:hypothetical protein FGO68_gene13824 [Halteria grandinella]
MLTVSHTYIKALSARPPQCHQRTSALHYMLLWSLPVCQAAQALPGDSHSEHTISHTLSHHSLTLGDLHVWSCKTFTSSAVSLCPRPAEAQLTTSTSPSCVLSLLQHHYQYLQSGGIPSSGRKTSPSEREDHTKTGPALKSRDSLLTSSQASRE